MCAVCTCAYVYVNVLTYTMSVEVRSRCQVPSSNTYFLRKDLSLNLQLPILARLISYQAVYALSTGVPGICHCTWQ